MKLIDVTDRGGWSVYKADTRPAVSCSALWKTAAHGSALGSRLQDVSLPCDTLILKGLFEMGGCYLDTA